MIDCTPASIIEASKCYCGLTAKEDSAVAIYLLCTWANQEGGPVTCGTPSDVIQISGAGNGDSNGIYVRNPSSPLDTFNSMDDPQAGLKLTAGHWVMFYGLAFFERYYSTTEDFPCTWTIGPDGTLPVPTGQWLASPPVAWAPANEPVTWNDSGGAHVGDLPTFLATANFPSVSSLVFGGTGNLTSLTGLKYLPSLLTIVCNNNALTSLDCTNCFALTTLNCSSNASLTTLTLTGCTALTSLDCNSCAIGPTITGLSDCTSLTSLDCSFNALTSLSVTTLTSLVTLSCQFNSLVSLTGVAGITSLKHFTCNDNSITTIDVTGCTALEDVTCFNNALTSLTGISGLLNLLTVDASNNAGLVAIDASGCSSLDDMECLSCGLTSLNVTGCTAMTIMDCDTNLLTAITGITSCTALTTLQTENNSLISLNLSGFAALTNLTCQNNSLTSLDVSGCTTLTSINCSSNSMNATNVSIVLCAVDANGTFGGILNITSNSVPTAGGLVCSANLDPGKGWTVTHD